MRAAPLSEWAARMHSFELVGGAPDRARAPAARRSAPASGFRPPSRNSSSIESSLEIADAHATLRFSVWNSSSSSSTPTEWSLPAQHRLRVGRCGLARRSPARPSVPAGESGGCRGPRRPDSTTRTLFAADHQQAPVRRCVGASDRRRGTGSRPSTRASDTQISSSPRTLARPSTTPLAAGAAANGSGGVATSATTAVGSASHSAPMRKITTDCVVAFVGRLRRRRNARPLARSPAGASRSSSCRGRRGVHRAVAAVHVLRQLRARPIAAHADAVPAVVEAASSRDGADRRSRQALRLLRAAARGRSGPAPRPCLPCCSSSNAR